MKITFAAKQVIFQETQKNPKKQSTELFGFPINRSKMISPSSLGKKKTLSKGAYSITSDCTNKTLKWEK